jgi:hypothetical protein
MIAFGKIRSVAFAFGVAAVVVSLGLVGGSYLRPVDSMDYFKQADEARPWIGWGFDCAALGLFLCFFGRRWWRVAGIALALLLSIWWIGAMGALL